MIQAHQKNLRDWVTCNLLPHKTHTNPICLLPSFSLSVLTNKRPAVWGSPLDSAVVILYKCCFVNHRRVGLGKQRQKAELWLQRGTVLSWCAIWSGHAASLSTSFTGRHVTQPRPVWQSCRRICGQNGIPSRTKGTRCYVWYVCQLCTGTILASYLYLILYHPSLPQSSPSLSGWFAPWRSVSNRSKPKVLKLSSSPNYFTNCHFHYEVVNSCFPLVCE